MARVLLPRVFVHQAGAVNRTILSPELPDSCATHLPPHTLASRRRGRCPHASRGAGLAFALSLGVSHLAQRTAYLAYVPLVPTGRGCTRVTSKCDGPSAKCKI